MGPHMCGEVGALQWFASKSICDRLSLSEAIKWWQTPGVSRTWNDPPGLTMYDATFIKGEGIGYWEIQSRFPGIWPLW